MKKPFFAVLGLLVLMALIHFLLWPVNRGMYEGMQTLHKKTKIKEIVKLDEFRKKLEFDEREKLKTWGQIRNGHVEIPVDRALDYYARGVRASE